MSQRLHHCSKNEMHTKTRYINRSETIILIKYVRRVVTYMSAVEAFATKN